MTKLAVIIISFLLLQMNCQASYGEGYVLISHPDNPVEQLTSLEIKRIFLGKMKKWPNGSAIQVVVNINKEIHPHVTKKFFHKSPSQYSNYWKQILFSGKSMLPVFVKNDEDAKRYVGKYENTLSFISVNNYDNTLSKIVIVQ